MKLTHVELCGFRGYRKPVRIEFGDRLTIIDGRNGAGKSTIFDAVEFVITGTLTKYRDARAAGETVEDYLWWTGEEPSPEEKFVEVGFRNEDTAFSVRRSQLDDPPQDLLDRLKAGLCYLSLSPAEPLGQICTASIIRDEQITELSLDMKEADRYALLRGALGATDADKWIARASHLQSLAKRKVEEAEREVAAARNEVAAAGRRLDEIRAALVADTVIGQAASRLQKFAETSAAPDQLLGPVRSRIAEHRARIDEISNILDQWKAIENQRQGYAVLKDAADKAAAEKRNAEAELANVVAPTTPPASTLAEQARDLIALVSLGRKLGLRDDHCPLCAKEQTYHEFMNALQASEEFAAQLNEQAAAEAQAEQKRVEIARRIQRASQLVEETAAKRASADKAIEGFENRLRKLDLKGQTEEEIKGYRARLNQVVQEAENDARILETLKINESLAQAQRADTDAKSKFAQANQKLSRSHKVQADAHALHSAAVRAASETLDLRLERVLPLLAELYRRLRPHPVWSDIEYSIRGDVRRFLRLQVGKDINPQFIFSSGQRRATGLAFLLAVNLSLAWSRWRTILLDDPVQHIDDFRSVHLAELLAQLVTADRQIICAVEDAALADMLGRRLPIGSAQEAKRITLGPDNEGALTQAGERYLMPLPAKVLVSSGESSATA